MEVVEVEKLKKVFEENYRQFTEPEFVPLLVKAINEIIDSCECYDYRSPEEIERAKIEFEKRYKAFEEQHKYETVLLATVALLLATAEIPIELCDWFCCRNNDFDPPSDKAKKEEKPND